MENPYAAPATDVREAEYDVAGAAPYTVAQMRSAFTRFAWAYWGYIGAIVVFVGAMSVMVVKTLAQSAGSGGQPTEADVERAMQGMMVGMGVFGLILLVIAVLMTAFAMILLYRYWAVMQPYSKRTTPGKAVGFLFIPLFNLYWMFVAYHGLSKDIDTYLDRNRSSRAPRPSTGLVLATVIVMLVTMVPYVGNLAALALMVLLFLMKLRLNNSIIGIIQDRARQQASTAPTK
jgi:hypothetical protein